MILILIAADYLAICLAFVASYWIRFKTELGIFYVHEGSPQGFYSSLAFLAGSTHRRDLRLLPAL
jgi:hypothetical protein